MNKITIPPEYETELYRCVRCGFCTPTCPIYEAKGTESWNCRGRIIIEKELSLGTLNVTNDVFYRLYTCTLCKICETNCPAKIQVTTIQEHVREQLVKQGLGPLTAHHEIKENILNSGNIAGNSKPQFETHIEPYIDKIPDDSTNLLFSGCVGTFNYPNITVNAIKLLQHAKYDFTMIKTGETCCSGFLKVVGFASEFEEIAKRNINIFEEKGINHVLSACPMCYGSFQNEYSNISHKTLKAQHLVQVLEDLLDNNKFKFRKTITRKVLFYDGCHLGRYNHQYNAPRKILENIPGIELVELPRSRDQTPCCGGTIRNPYIELRDHLSDNIINQALKAGADIVVPACPTCFHNLRSAGIMYNTQVVDFTSMIAYSCGLTNSL